MLIMDRASSYTNEKFVKVYYNKNIFLFRLLSYITHLFQPCDIICFQLLKYYYSKVIDNTI